MFDTVRIAKLPRLSPSGPSHIRDTEPGMLESAQRKLMLSPSVTVVAPPLLTTVTVGAKNPVG